MFKRVKTVAAVSTLAAVLALGVAPVVAEAATRPATAGSSIEQVQASTTTPSKKSTKKSASKKTKKAPAKKTS